MNKPESEAQTSQQQPQGAAIIAALIANAGILQSTFRMSNQKIIKNS